MRSAVGLALCSQLRCRLHREFEAICGFPLQLPVAQPVAQLVAQLADDWIDLH